MTAADPQIEFLRRAALCCAALSFLIALSYTIEQPLRLSWEPHLWLATVNASDSSGLLDGLLHRLDLIALVAAGMLALLIRQPGPGLVLAFCAAFLLFFAHTVWSLAVLPVQSLTANWPGGTIPADFSEIRTNWEYALGFVVVLKFGALASLYFIREIAEDSEPQWIEPQECELSPTELSRQETLARHEAGEQR